MLPFLFYPSLLDSTTVISSNDHLSLQSTFSDHPPQQVANPLQSDPALLLYPIQTRVKKSLRQLIPPLWNPDIYAGTPLLGGGHSKLTAPSTWLGLIFKAHHAKNIEVWLLLMWFGLGSHNLCRQLGLTTAEGGLGAIAALSVPFVHVWLHHPIALGAVWLPWLLLSIARQSSTLCVLATFAILACGHPGTILHVALIAMGTCVVLKKPPPLIGMGIGILCAACLWMPQIELILSSETLESRGGNSLPLSSLADIFWPQFYGHPSLENWSGQAEWSSGQLHAGWVTLALAIYGLKHPTTQERSIWLLFGWVLAIAISVTGLPGPVNHTRLAGMGMLILAPAAGLGAKQLSRTQVRIATVLILIFGLWSNRLHQSNIGIDMYTPKPANWVLDLSEKLNCHQKASRCSRFLGIGNMIIPNTGSLANLKDLRGYDLPLSKQTRRFMGALSSPPKAPWFPVTERPSDNLLQFANVRALVYAIDHVVWLDDSPRAWFTESATPVVGPQKALEEISLSDRRSTPPVEGLDKPLIGSKTITALSVEEPYPEYLHIDIEPVSAGFVVLSDSWNKGWIATIDGKSAKILRTGGHFRGVIIPEGGKKLEMRYQPWTWVWGSRISLFGSFLLIIGFFIPKTNGRYG